MSTNKEGILSPTDSQFRFILLNTISKFVNTISHNIFLWQRQRKSTTANRDTMLTFPPATTHLHFAPEGYGIETVINFPIPHLKFLNLQVKRHISAYKVFFFLIL